MNERPPHSWQPARNWPLWIGLLLLAVLLILAWLGPTIAPHDPVKPVYIVRDPATGTFVKPPFRPGQMPGYPLGTDLLGRDTWSQLLWALQPTLTLVLVAAAVRLLIGLLIGLASGWGTGRRARLLEGLTTMAVSIPVLLIALALVAAFGPRWGVWAFILGLCLTGWAETARMAHDQTSLIKTQPYVEAARALGGSELSMVFKHVLPHVLPLAWIMLPFEISTALLVTAGLGFLGYYVNAIWIPLGDWTAVRAAGKPELGQMLASGATMAQQHPWLLLVTGAAIFLLILGFNLVGEGLRRQADPARVRRRRGRVGAAFEQASAGLNAMLQERLAVGRGGVVTAIGLGALLLLLLGSTLALLNATRVPAAASAIAVPGGQLWPTTRHDAQGTFWANSNGPTKPLVVWQVARAEGFIGGPVVAADGTLYVNTADSRVLAVTPAGQTRWEVKLPEPLFGAPALDAQGNIAVVDEQGALYVLTPQGDLLWSLQLDGAGLPLASPLINADGVVYLATERRLLAARAPGELVWQTGLPTYSYISPQPTLSPDGRFLLFEDILIDAASGQIAVDATDPLMDRYVVGADGKLYLAAQDNIAVVEITGDTLHIEPQAQLDVLSLALGFRFPSHTSITPDGRIWSFYGTLFDYAKLLWTEADGSTLNVVDYPWTGPTSRVLALDERATMYVCGNNASAQRGGLLECGAYSVNRPAATWKLSIEPGGLPLGGALVNGRLYLLSEKALYAIADGEP